ncbi:MAG: hypothetical protein K2Y22_14225 [Candidatus Obscuribacterales bacterium]|nr:hypothetical protein [Candidatus Obscuribacterales bacterium]
MKRQKYTYSPKQLDAQQFETAAKEAKFHRDLLDRVLAQYPRRDGFTKTVRGAIQREIFFYAEVWALNVHKLNLGWASDFVAMLEKEVLARTNNGKASWSRIEKVSESVAREYIFAPLFELLSTNAIETGTQQHCSFTIDDDRVTPAYWLYSHEDRCLQGDFFQKPLLQVDISSHAAFAESVAKLTRR